MTKRFFITGTDTEVGKTYISVGLLKTFRQKGLSTLGIKPVASGCIDSDGKLVNEDALALQKASTVQLPYSLINPFAFAPPIAPHIAAAKAQRPLSVATLIEHTQPALAHGADVQIIEGAGGWLVPLNDTETISDFVASQKFNTILVVGIRLGCINHALLTYQVITAMSVNVVGWVANIIVPETLFLPDVIATLKQRLPCPCLGVVDYNAPPERVLDVESCN